MCAGLEVPLQVTGLGSMFGIHFVDAPIHDWRDVVAADAGLRRRVFWGMLNEGVLFTPNLFGCVSNAMGEGEVDSFVGAFQRVLERNLD